MPIEEYADRLRKTDWEVRPVTIEIAGPIVRNCHYSKGHPNTATYLHGLFKKSTLWDYHCAGVAWWIPPTKAAALATYPENWKGVLSLSRLALIEGIPKNACSFLLARSVKLIDRKLWPCLVTYADTWQGHTGTIYRASNWQEVGSTTPEATFTIKGVMTARKAGGHTRTHAEMIALGARFEGRHSRIKFVLK